MTAKVIKTNADAAYRAALNEYLAPYLVSKSAETIELMTESFKTAWEKSKAHTFQILNAIGNEDSNVQ